MHNHETLKDRLAPYDGAYHLVGYATPEQGWAKRLRLLDATRRSFVRSLAEHVCIRHEFDEADTEPMSHGPAEVIDLSEALAAL